MPTQHFIEFQHRRELYEKQEKEKGRHLGDEIVATIYQTSIEIEDLRIFIAAGWMEGFSIGELTKSQIKTCIERKCKRKETG